MESVANYEQVQITRADIATTVFTDALATATPSRPKGSLNGSVIDTFLEITATARNSRDRTLNGKKSIVVINVFVMDRLTATNLKASAK